ncbi:MAG TPA: phosphate ABC transporter substrate-binding protein PstS [Gaiellaceae bacterium]|jgi:phosphate transport system substrate-binding protein
MPKTGMLVKISLAVVAAATIATVAVSAAGAARQSTSLSGAGSTFVQPLINAWTQLPSQSQSPFTKAKHITVTYGGGGSGAGVSDIIAKTVAFGASDAPLTSYATTCKTCVQTPWALSGTAMIYHISGVTKTLNMSGPVLAKIYLGTIKYWDDKAIKAINKGVSIPHTAITTVHRDSSSGTTYNFTDFLSHVSSTWKNKYGATTLIGTWPGNNVQAHGSNGVAAAVANTNGAIGYVDLWYGITAHLKYMSIENQHGRFVQPTLSSIAQASKLDTTPKADGTLSIVNPPNKTKYFGAYPISTYTYVDVQKHSGSKATPLKTFLLWAVTSGQSHAAANYFVPLPSGVVSWDKTHIKQIVS